jgi:hypothetical protein
VTITREQVKYLVEEARRGGVQVRLALRLSGWAALGRVNAGRRGCAGRCGHRARGRRRASSSGGTSAGR